MKAGQTAGWGLCSASGQVTKRCRGQESYGWAYEAKRRCLSMGHSSAPGPMHKDSNSSTREQ